MAIRQAWEECGEVPFPLYESEAEELAKAAITAIYRPAADETERLRADRGELLALLDAARICFKAARICFKNRDQSEREAAVYAAICAAIAKVSK